MSTWRQEYNCYDKSFELNEKPNLKKKKDSQAQTKDNIKHMTNTFNWKHNC